MLGCDKKPRRMAGVLRHWKIPAHNPHGVQTDIFLTRYFLGWQWRGDGMTAPPADGLRARHGPRMDWDTSASNRLRKSARDGLFRITACCLGQERKGHSKMERNEIRCGNCGKLLGKGTALDFEIKCPRCKAINHLRASDSPCSETPEDPSERNHARKH